MDMYQSSSNFSETGDAFLRQDDDAALLTTVVNEFGDASGATIDDGDIADEIADVADFVEMGDSIPVELMAGDPDDEGDLEEVGGLKIRGLARKTVKRLLPARVRQVANVAKRIAGGDKGAARDLIRSAAASAKVNVLSNILARGGNANSPVAFFKVVGASLKTSPIPPKSAHPIYERYLTQQDIFSRQPYATAIVVKTESAGAVTFTPAATDIIAAAAAEIEIPFFVLKFSGTYLNTPPGSVIQVELKFMTPIGLVSSQKFTIALDPKSLESEMAIAPWFLVQGVPQYVRAIVPATLDAAKMQIAVTGLPSGSQVRIEFPGKDHPIVEVVRQAGRA